jgi:adenine-specific DNA methylase
MKYMGSKRSMLANGLGTTLRKEVTGAKRFADLFAGSGSVAWHVAESFSCSVEATDLQLFSAILSDAVIGRVSSLAPEFLWKSWSSRAKLRLSESSVYSSALRFDEKSWGSARRQSVEEARTICTDAIESITRAYGGYYFSPSQALALDALRSTIPTEGKLRSVALAALVSAASQCAAAPGHTAQPFQPTAGAAKFLFEGWRRDVWEQAWSALEQICSKHAQRMGEGKVGTAESLAKQLGPEDVAFLDPPYSGGHYSRFYHVLETVAQGTCEEVSGVGRYPPPSERPKSEFSVATKSKDALDRLFQILAERDVRTIVTFPKDETSNGLSGSIVEALARKHFKISKHLSSGRFSTLGGNLKNREAHIPSYEIILTLTPRS